MQVGPGGASALRLLFKVKFPLRRKEEKAESRKVEAGGCAYTGGEVVLQGRGSSVPTSPSTDPGAPSRVTVLVFVFEVKTSLQVTMQTAGLRWRLQRPLQHGLVPRPRCPQAAWFLPAVLRGLNQWLTP